MENTITIDGMNTTDWEQVLTIYQEGIDTGNATFRTKAPTWEEWNHYHLMDCRLVAREGDKVLGWAALTPTSKMEAYAGAAELSIYVGRNSKGKGVGSQLLQALIQRSEEKGFWTLQAGIFPENTSSIHLHKKHGFREVGRREHIGKLNGVWRDVILLERRSHVVGME
ncbi:GNAT family N-acetyltransferase [Salinibacillus xinjiangensis]|uniref:GNAT family N-acetyltransferase n=1 Tax=Salinibacillus xinjiangensis TaxID=1229268 RepID=A0A6G1X5B1_9BACI|nr:GNAT family N-acetyltransferase [Salinibacillus xinjiangensis]MRG86127.1 GNAT family N-acetyltransferase [Salinibacillus xinjiangensis]